MNKKSLLELALEFEPEVIKPAPMEHAAPSVDAPAEEFAQELGARTFTIKDGKADFKGTWELNKIMRTLHDEGLLYEVEQ